MIGAIATDSRRRRVEAAQVALFPSELVGLRAVPVGRWAIAMPRGLRNGSISFGSQRTGTKTPGPSDEHRHHERRRFSALSLPRFATTSNETLAPSARVV
jgi:hypothetical protein